jgi:hypothetical protein
MTELTLEQQLCVPARQGAQLSPPPASSFASKRRHRPAVTVPILHKGIVAGWPLAGTKEHGSNILSGRKEA